uniref:Uncharacterized protein n=1 Tax=Cannabis sativa TaxID=3483 RepID=A0A803P1C8_CANSA
MKVPPFCNEVKQEILDDVDGCSMGDIAKNWWQSSRGAAEFYSEVGRMSLFSRIANGGEGSAGWALFGFQ